MNAIEHIVFYIFCAVTGFLIGRLLWQRKVDKIFTRRDQLLKSDEEEYYRKQLNRKDEHDPEY